MSPVVHGSPIEISFLPGLRARRGELGSGEGARGREVHAGSFLRRRSIVLDSALRKRPRELRRILTHELFHFVWLRLGNPRRRAWEALLQREIAVGVRGELGWSAESLKTALTRADRMKRSRRWREYVCESFCDSAAWLFAAHGHHEEFTLPCSARRARRQRFRSLRLDHEISV
jgi:hypothetical protein